MKLVFKNLGPIDGFTQWLKNFAVMAPSLLIEVDTKDKKFISKAFTVDKGLVRYSEISFADCNLEIEEKVSDIPEVRLKLGIFLMLQKFITVCETFSPVDFKIIIDYEKMIDDHSQKEELVSDSITLKSKTLKMRIDEAAASEFTYLDDKIFNDSIHVAPNPILLVITPETIKNIISISGIFSTDSKKDIMILYSKNDEDGPSLYARDKSSNYEYNLGVYQHDGPFSEFSASIFREKFLLSMKGVSEDVNLSMSTIDTTRILLDTISGTSKTVISIVNE